MGIFNQRNQLNGKTQVPVWFMRQAGRYHKHYQNLKAQHDFMTLCKNSDLAKEVTLGPINDFNFDAAILFSDLLFPLEHLSMGLSYHSGPPTLNFHLNERENLNKLHQLSPSAEFYQFQKSALEMLKKELSPNVSLLGFVGAPFTLYTYAMEGAHAGNLVEAKKGLYDGSYGKFLEKLFPSLIDNMLIQASGGADAICLFDTAAGELSLTDYKRFAIPAIKDLTRKFKDVYPNKKIVYYSKHTHLHYLTELNDPNIDVLGIDWRVNLTEALNTLGKKYYIQGNIDPVWLHLPWSDLQSNLLNLWESVKLNPNLNKWIFGLGHGVLIKTPEENVKNTVELIHQHFHY